jgi:acyl-coenzyme A synthetase/AMP-(fatty) acid ligase
VLLRGAGRGLRAHAAQLLDAWCRQSLAGYKRPRRVEFAEALPKTVTGKALKRELRDRYATPS